MMLTAIFIQISFVFIHPTWANAETAEPYTSGPTTRYSREYSKYFVPRRYFSRNSEIDNNSYNEFNDLYNKFRDNPKLKNSRFALQRALAFYAKNKNGIPSSCGGDMGAVNYRDIDYKPIEKIENQRYILIADYSIADPTKDRFFILDTQSGEVISSPVAHGYGSNKDCPKSHQIKCPKGTKCKLPASIGNGDTKIDTGLTSRGFYLTDAPYTSGQQTFKGGSPKSRGHNALSLRGLIKDVNDNALLRDVVFHRASYAGNLCSNSAGCPAIEPQIFEDIKEDLGRSLMYIHTKEDEKKPQPDC